MSPPSRFCASCGAPAIPDSSHCARCGVVLAPLPSTSSPSGAVRAAAAEPGRSAMPSLLAGVAACTVGGFFFLVCGGIVAAIAIPNLLKSTAATKSQAAQANLKALWAAEQSWAAAHDGEYLEFYVDDVEPTDENLRKLQVDLGKLHYSYEALYDSDDVFMISAVGNIDEDESVDEWQLYSDDPAPFHAFDDITEEEHYPEEIELPDELTEEGGGGIGLKGVGTGGSPEAEAKSATARANLEAIWQGQQAYRIKKKTFLAFDKGSAATWSALGLSALPEAENHAFAATVSGDSLTLSATANLDADAFEDEWTLASADGIPIQVKNDSLNLDLSELSNILRELSTKEKPE